MSARTPLPPLAHHRRFAYAPIHRRPHFSWPEGRGLAVYIGFNLEHFAFGEGLGARIGPPSSEPDVLNYSWREYGNRVGAWRCLELFDEFSLPTGAIINTALYDHCPELPAAFHRRGDEIIAHGHSNAVRQSELSEADEYALILACRDRIAEATGDTPSGWLSPWIDESFVTPDLLSEAGYEYTLNWCHDDQPVRMLTRSGRPLWSIPYPQEINDIPMLVARQMDTAPFVDMIIDNLDEMIRQARRQPLVMGIALHPYLMGQPYRIKHLRRALAHIAAAREAGELWITTPGRIARHMDALDASGTLDIPIDTPDTPFTDTRSA